MLPIFWFELVNSKMGKRGTKKAHYRNPYHNVIAHHIMYSIYVVLYTDSSTQLKSNCTDYLPFPQNWIKFLNKHRKKKTMKKTVIRFSILYSTTTSNAKAHNNIASIFVIKLSQQRNPFRWNWFKFKGNENSNYIHHHSPYSLLNK